MLNNSGPHFVDMGMLLIDDPEPEVFCHMETTPLYAGDADSHVKVILKPKRGPLVEINIITACAFPQPNFLVLGTQGLARLRPQGGPLALFRPRRRASPHSGRSADRPRPHLQSRAASLER